MNPTNTCIIENIEEWLKPTLEKLSLTNYKISISGHSAKGDGYLGDITFTEVFGYTTTGEENTYSFVIKSGKKSKELREIMPIRQVFENEMFFYSDILPTFVAFQKEKGVEEPFNNAPKCYGSLIHEDTEVIILENMKTRNYFLHDRQKPMNKQHIKQVIESYGKLHAISYAIRDQQPEVFKKLSEKLVDILKIMPNNMKSAEEQNLYEDIIKAAREDNEEEVIEKALILNQKARTFNDITDPQDPFAVILHGDCWNNNFMFKYQDHENSIPSKVCFLDFQISRLASPVYDLSYFLFTCLSKKTVNEFDEINDWYYECMSNSLREMGSDPNKMFPREELTNQWKKFSLFGLVLMPSIIRICLSDSDEVPDLVEAAESGTDLVEMFTRSVRNKDQFRERTVPVMKLAIKKGLV